MGCTDSSAVAQHSNKNKPVFAMLPESSIADVKDIWLGEVQQNIYVCSDVIVTNQSENIQIRQRPMPLLIAGEHPQKLKLPNFAQMTRIGSSSLYLITGGINFKLNHIYSDVYLFNSKLNRLYPLNSLKQPRYTHSAVFYNNSLFIIGGRYFGQDDNDAILKHCQKISLKINQSDTDEQIQQAIRECNSKWIDIGPLNTKRCSHISVIYNKRIYTFGGYTGQCQRSTLIEFYQLNQKQDSKWKNLSVQLPFGIQSSCFIANNSNEITIFGGNSNQGPLESVLTLNLLQGYESIHSNRRLQSKKVLHKISQFSQKVYIFGGSGDLKIQFYQLRQAENQKNTQSGKIIQNKKSLKDKQLQKYFKTQQIFEALTNSLNTINIPFKNQPPIFQFQKTEDDQIAYIFGTSNQPFILQLNISVPYAALHPMPLSIKLHALQGAVYLKSTQEYLLFGGISDSQEDVKNQTYLYNPNSATKFSRLVAKMITPRYAFGYEIIGDWVYAIAGGSSDEEGDLIILNKCQKLSIKNFPKLGSQQLAQWIPICDIPLGLISPMTLNYKNSLYVFGGMKKNKERFQNILKYKQTNNTWQELKFTFPFGLQASSIYQKSSNEYWIFGGRVVNGDTKNIWALTFINDEDCVFQQKGQMKQSKCLHHVYKPKHQNFIVILGGQKQVLSFYDCQSLKAIQSDILNGMKKNFTENLTTLADKTLKNYKVVIKQ